MKYRRYSEGRQRDDDLSDVKDEDHFCRPSCLSLLHLAMARYIKKKNV